MKPRGGPVGLIPLGPVSNELIDTVAGAVNGRFGWGCLVFSQKDLPAAARDSGRNQFIAKSVLEHLRSHEHPGCCAVVGITEVDLGNPVLTFVFGEAEVKGKVGLVSACRLREEYYSRAPEQALFAQRLIKEVLHELGHVFGLIHCPHDSCVMRRSSTLAETDSKSSEFCMRCMVLLDGM